MPTCQKISHKKKNYCIGDLRYNIKLIDRSIEPTDEGYTMNTDDFVSTMSGCRTGGMVQVFGGVNIVEVQSHIFPIRFRTGIEIYEHVEYNNKYYRIMGTEDLNEDHRFIEITAVERGLIDKQANL
jgi:hypothetical protein